jgi:protein TonB
MIAVRFGFSLVMGLFITLLLFFVMQALIQSGRSVLQEGGSTTIVDFVRLKQEQILETKKRKLEKPPPPDEPPPEIRPQLTNVAIDKTGYTMADLDMSVNIEVSGGDLESVTASIFPSSRYNLCTHSERYPGGWKAG